MIRHRPAVVAIDSQGDMLRTLSRLHRFDPALDDRLIILDPADTAWPLRLNMFDINRARIDALSLGAREQILAGIVELYDYIFGSLLGAELTQKQSVVFRYIARLMLEIPDANIQTLRQLMEEKQFSAFAPYIAKLRGHHARLLRERVLRPVVLAHQAANPPPPLWRALQSDLRAHVLASQERLRHEGGLR